MALRGPLGAAFRWGFLRYTTRIHRCLLAQSGASGADAARIALERLEVATAAANARERLRRTAQVVVWATLGALRRADVSAMSAYESRGRDQGVLAKVAAESEAHARLYLRFRALPREAQESFFEAAAQPDGPRPDSAEAAARALEAAACGSLATSGRRAAPTTLTLAPAAIWSLPGDGRGILSPTSGTAQQRRELDSAQGGRSPAQAHGGGAASPPPGAGESARGRRAKTSSVHPSPPPTPSPANDPEGAVGA